MYYGHPLDAVRCMCGWMDYRYDGEKMTREVGTSWRSPEAKARCQAAARKNGQRRKAA
jgi:hypothetical protein